MESDTLETSSSTARTVGLRYRIEKLLGKGGMGEVFLAFDTLEKRLVALKLVLPTAEDPARHLLQFKQEFREAQTLRHKHLVEVFDFGVDGSRPFFTMELVDGEALEVGRSYPYGVVCDLMVQLLLPLELIHSRGKLHRDLKPENLKFNGEGVLKVLDLGLLEAIGTVHACELTGTLSYMAPESFSGKPLSAPMDLYSVGIIAYELLTGAPPFTYQEPSEQIQAHMLEVPVPLAERAPELPAELASLLMSLLEKDPQARPQRAGDVIRALAPWTSSQLAEEARLQAYSYLLAPSLVGRKQEMALLLGGRRAALEGAGQAVFIGAPSGVGKSRLIQELKLACQLDNVPFLSARCTFESGGAYGAFRQLLAALIPYATPEILERYRTLVRALVDGGPAISIDGGMIQAALTEFIAEVARHKPLVLWIDDMQWADTLSLKILAYCLDQHRDVPIFWVGSYRIDEVPKTHPVVQMLEDGSSQGVALAPLNRSETAELVSGMLGTPNMPAGLEEILAEAAQGNAFFITEMMRFLVDQDHLRYAQGAWQFTRPLAALGIPRSIDDLVAKRLEDLSGPGLKLARLAAVLGEDLDVKEALTLADMPEQELLDALNELVTRQVFQQEGDHYRFVHDRIWEGLYQALGETERRKAHEDLAWRLEANKRPASTLAHHFVQAGLNDRGITYLRKAGLAAERIGASKDSYRHWKQAAEILEAHPGLGRREHLLELWLDLGMKCGFSVDSKLGEEVLRKALAELAPVGRPLIAARFLGLLLKLIKVLTGPFSVPIIRVLSKPIPYRPPRGIWKRLPPNYLALVPLLIEANTWLAVCCNSNGNISGALEANRQAQALVPDRDSWAWGIVMTAYAYSRVLEGKWDECVQVARDSYELMKGESHPNAINMACGALVLGNNQSFTGAPIDEACARTLMKLATDHHLAEWQGMSNYAAMAHYPLVGKSSEALQAIDEAQPYSKRCGRGTVLEREIFLAKARVHTQLGEFEQALEAIAQGVRLDRIVSLPYFTSRFFEISGRVYLEQGRLDEAEREFQETIERESSYGIKFTIPEAQLGLSEVERRRGNLDKAETYLSEAEAIINDPDYRCEVKRIYLERQKGRIALSRQDGGAAQQCLLASLELARAQDNAWQSALTLTDLGEWAEATHESKLAILYWQEALECYQAIDNAYGQRKLRTLLGRGATTGNAIIAGNRLEVLREFADAITRAHATQEVLDTLLDHAMAFLGAERGAIMRLLPSGAEALAFRSGGSVAWARGPVISQSLMRNALEADHAVMVADVLQDQQLSTQRTIMGQALRTLVCLPIKTESEPMILYADRQALLEGGFDQGHLYVLESLVSFGQIALNNAFHAEQTQARSERLAILNQLSLLVSSTLDVKQILDHLLGQVLKITRGELALVIEAKEGDCRVLDGRSASGETSGLMYSRSVVKRVLDTKAPLCILDTEASEQLSDSKSIHALGLKSIMCVPLEFQDQMLGVLYVSSQLTVRAFTDADLELLRAIAAHAALALHNARQVVLMQEKSSIEQELKIAHSIQQGFFPKQEPSLAGLEIFGVCKPAKDVGGDYYDIVPLTNGKVALVLGDVSGKNVSASLYMAVVRTAMRMALRFDSSPKNCLIEVNRQICTDIKDSSFVTCFLGIYDPVTREFAYASAGHHLGYWKQGAEVKKLGSRGVPLGLDPAIFDSRLNVNSVTLEAGDQLVLFTDGVIEALSPEREEFGSEGLLAAMALFDESAEGSLNITLDAIARHVKDAQPWDDLTMLFARVKN